MYLRNEGHMCTGIYQCMSGYQVIIPVSDNYKSSVSCTIVRC